ncbi:hypothetical protein BGW38_005069 [Lunasporangiospora selenospora]|uniref:C2H2-type domain-containing protein n=1 Tax=Lunasporangiospora selenospora TaxID=979761 RepID=A0A9P6FZT3_9FUNG|nr:hypothetical protein BGW38_005069 [Lunasporangiospora selenospora]
MSNEGEWTTVTSKGSSSHKQHGVKSTNTTATTGAGSSSQSTSKSDTTARAKTGGSGAHSHHHHHHKKPVKKDAPLTKTSTGASKKEGATTGKISATSASRNREHSDSDSSDSESDGQSDYPARPPYYTTILIHCPFQSCNLTDPLTDSTSLVAHLKEAHHIAFKNIHHMFILLDRYLTHWAEEIERQGIEKVAIKEEGDDFYTIDPAQSSADRSLRDVIQREKLNEILKIQEKERNEEAKQKRKCLFCKNVCDNRPVLFKHMFAEHNFNIGLPDNLVNVNEFLDMLEAKLTNLQCLYCEKTFTSPAVLRKHMRKKKHFKISARNRLYDQFYVINYLEPGMNWEHFENDRYESEDDRRDDSWADWDEALDEEKAKCLFENVYFSSAQATRDHMKEAHGFDLDRERHQLGLDFYQTISLINYIRRQTLHGVCFSCLKTPGSTTGEEKKEGDASLEKQDPGEALVKHLKEEGCGAKIPSMDAEFWKDPQFLLPMLENDPLLMVFGDEASDEEEEEEALAEDGTRRVRSSRSSDSEGDDEDDEVVI